MTDNHNLPALVTLIKIADALGVSAECFFTQASPTVPVASEDECLRLWSEIRTEEGRQQALAVMRVIATLEAR